MTQHTESSASHPPREPRVTLRGPADLAEALPFILGFHPDDSIVMVALHGARGRFGGRLRLGIPADPAEWRHVAAQLADCLIGEPDHPGRPDGIAVYLCQDPRPGEQPQQTMERLRPLAQHLRTACGALDVPVMEALCVSDGRWWSYCCPDTGCCPPDGTPIPQDGTSVMAAAAAYAGLQVRGSLKDMQARYTPLSPPRAHPQETALDQACAELVPRMLRDADTLTIREETLTLTEAALHRFRTTPAATDDTAGDAHDNTLLGDDEAAAIILGLQDRETRDQAAEWMEGQDAAPALRLWRALARRCVGAYTGHSAAPLTLAGWVCWSIGDEPAARVAFDRALDADPEYTFAKLLHRACNRGLDPEPLRQCLRQERRKRQARATTSPQPTTGPKGRPATDTSPANRPDTRRRAPRPSRAKKKDGRRC